MKKEKNNKDPYGIPNCNFTLITRKDLRWKKFKEQRLRLGFDESELWDFEYSLTSWMLPRVEWYYTNIVCDFKQCEKDVFKKLIYCIWFLKNQEDIFYSYYNNGFTDQYILVVNDCREYIKENMDYIFNIGW